MSHEFIRIEGSLIKINNIKNYGKDHELLYFQKVYSIERKVINSWTGRYQKKYIHHGKFYQLKKNKKQITFDIERGKCPLCVYVKEGYLLGVTKNPEKDYISTTYKIYKESDSAVKKAIYTFEDGIYYLVNGENTIKANPDDLLVKKSYYFYLNTFSGDHIKIMLDEDKIDEKVKKLDKIIGVVSI
jgi:putative sterol carrier protein